MTHRPKNLDLDALLDESLARLKPLPASAAFTRRVLAARHTQAVDEARYLLVVMRRPLRFGLVGMMLSAVLGFASGWQGVVADTEQAALAWEDTVAFSAPLFEEDSL